MDGYRRVIDLDRFFIKGICKGELLVDVGRDVNNNIFPITWCVISLENKENWKWFLDLLIDDLDLVRGNELTLTFDLHKVLCLFSCC